MSSDAPAARGDDDVHLHSFTLKNFRNYRSLDLEFDASGNLFLGGNAQGKTNLIEAIHYLATARSQRGAGDEKLLRQGADFFMVQGTGTGREGRSLTIEIRSIKDGPRRLKINGAVHRKVSDLLGLLSVVELSPEDRNIVAGGPGLRRRFLDFCLCQLSPSYWKDLVEYGRILQQRNTALKSRSGHRWHAADDDELSAWNGQLVRLGSAVVKRRQRFLEQIDPQVNELHRRITGGDERIALKYQPAIEEVTGRGIDEAFHRSLDRVREKEHRLGVTLAGPHRDDVLISVNERDLRTYGSQGQQRTAAIALKLAADRQLEVSRGGSPILLLDDVFAELDVDRTRALFDLFHGFGQIFVATAKESDLAGCGDHLTRMAVSDGTVTPVRHD
jgi:DNA replication and repair protein RecF